MDNGKMTGYMGFCKENMVKLNGLNNNVLGTVNLLKDCGKKWSSMTQEEKSVYIDRANAENQIFSDRETANSRGYFDRNRNLANIEKNRKNPKEKKETPKMKFSDISDYLDDDNKCLVCYNAIANVLYLPCKHRVSCKACCETLQETDNKNKCIKCRQDIDRFCL
jgi:hypothetical protein